MRVQFSNLCEPARTLGESNIFMFCVLVENSNFPNHKGKINVQRGKIGTESGGASQVGTWSCSPPAWRLQAPFTPPTLSYNWFSFLKDDSLKSPSPCFSLISHPNSGSTHFMPGLLKSLLTGFPNSGCSSVYCSNHFTLSF